jgi:hypothetical protein
MTADGMFQMQVNESQKSRSVTVDVLAQGRNDYHQTGTLCTSRLVSKKLNIYRANTQLPLWHPASQYLTDAYLSLIRLQRHTIDATPPVLDPSIQHGIRKVEISHIVIIKYGTRSLLLLKGREKSSIWGMTLYESTMNLNVQTFRPRAGSCPIQPSKCVLSFFFFLSFP